MPVLLTVIFAIVISALLLSGSNINQVNALKVKQADKTINELVIISQAAQKYVLDNSLWPDETNNCVNSINTMLTSPSKYLVNIDQQSPLTYQYTTLCPGKNLIIRLAGDDIYLGYVASTISLPSTIATNTFTSTNTITIDISVVPPLELSIADKFLALGATTATSTIYNGKGNSISNVSDVTLITGEQLSKAFIKQYTVKPTERVIKPICTSGSPRLQLSTNSFFASNNKPIYGLALGEDTAKSTTTDFAIFMNVFTEDGFVSPSTDTFVVATTYCL